MSIFGTKKSSKIPTFGRIGDTAYKELAVSWVVVVPNTLVKSLIMVIASIVTR